MGRSFYVNRSPPRGAQEPLNRLSILSRQMMKGIVEIPSKELGEEVGL